MNFWKTTITATAIAALGATIPTISAEAQMNRPMRYGNDCRRIVGARGGLNIREEPSTNSPVVEQVENGDRVAIHNRGEDGWVPVFSPQNGYVSANYLAYCQDNPAIGVNNECREVAAPDGLNVRRQPRGNSEVVDTLENNTQIAIETLGNEGWVPMYAPENGFVAARYLSYCGQ
ncbi:MAG: SH3 domain-containing protein [Spirulinaceae cyanobacterium]